MSISHIHISGNVTLGPRLRTKKLWNIKMTVTPVLIVSKRIGKGAERDGHQWTRRDYSIVKIGQRIKKSPRVLRRLAVTQTPVKDHQLTLEFKKNHQEQHNNEWKLILNPLKNLFFIFELQNWFFSPKK